MYVNNKQKNILNNVKNTFFKKNIYFLKKFYNLLKNNKKNEQKLRYFCKKQFKNNLNFRLKNLCLLTGKYKSIINHGKFKRHIFKMMSINNHVPRLKKLHK